KAHTLQNLKSVFTCATTVGNKTRSKSLKSFYGIKDTFQDHFTDLVFAFEKSLWGTGLEKQAQVDNLVSKFPTDVYSPVWQIRGEF
ncbi:hypothetical protein GYMLUDRAFT_168685, partial [Collybiopsis luxurians FD-317 M1]